MGSMNAGSVWKVLLLMVWVSGSATAQLFSTPSSSMTVQGSIFCRSGDKATALKGAKARVECQAALGGSSFSFISGGANDHGFYTASSNKAFKLQSCKVFLFSSPSWNCRIPTDTNGGKSGSSIIAISLLSKSYSAKPLFYTTN